MRRPAIGPRGRRLGAVLAALWTAACGGLGSPGGGAIPGARRFPADTRWPQTVSGTLEIAVEEGEAGADDISEINFGTLATA